MLAPQQTIMLACANLRCGGAAANIKYSNFEHPIFQGRRRNRHAIGVKIVQNFLYFAPPTCRVLFPLPSYFSSS